ncbi:MAG: hypothetical protein RIS88_1272 [Pseudomonadota bacterium]|jgi:thioredoxin 1
MVTPYAPETLSREDVDALPGATVLEFGTNWCSWCQGAQPAISQARAGLNRPERFWLPLPTT